MSASPLFRRLPGSQAAVPPPKLPSVMNMSDVHIIAPSVNNGETSRKAQRKAQLFQAFHRLLVKSPSHGNARKNWNATDTAPSAAVGGYTSSSQLVQPLPTDATEMLIPPPLPTPSVPRIGVIKTNDLSRSRTPQACERCRMRKTKCCGTHPTCKRCFTRGAECVYVLDHKANRALLKKQLKQGGGFFPKGLRPARKEGHIQRKPSPSRFDPLFRLFKSGSWGPSVGPSALGPASMPSQVAAPAPQDSSFEILDLSPPKTRLGPSPLSSMSWTAPDDSFAQMQAPAQLSNSALESSYSYMDLDSEVDAAVAFMMANESVPQPQMNVNGWESGFEANMLAPPPVMPSLSYSSQSGSGSGCDDSQLVSGISAMTTPIDEDVLMTDIFNSDILDAFEGGELFASDSELERELEAAMVEILGSGSTNADGTVKFGVDAARPMKPLPTRAVQPGQIPEPIFPYPGRSFPPIAVSGAYFDENKLDAFRPTQLTKIPEIRIEEAEENEVPEDGSAKPAQKEMTFDEIFGLSGGHLTPTYSGVELDLDLDEKEQSTVTEGEANEKYWNYFDPEALRLPTLWEELFGDAPLPIARTRSRPPQKRA